MESPSSAEEPKSRLAILVVDDDPDVLMYIVATLRRHGFTQLDIDTLLVDNPRRVFAGGN